MDIIAVIAIEGKYLNLMEDRSWRGHLSGFASSILPPEADVPGMLYDAQPAINRASYMATFMGGNVIDAEVYDPAPPGAVN